MCVDGDEWYIWSVEVKIHQLFSTLLDWNLFRPFLALENDTRCTGDYLCLSCSGRGVGGKKERSLGNLTLRLLMSYIYIYIYIYIYGAPILDVSRSHTTHHSRQDSSGRVISSSQRPLPDNTRHSQQTNIHAHDLSRWAACGSSPAEIVGSNPTGGMDICLLWVSCVVR